MPAYKIPGKTGKVPQPFSEMYSIDDSKSTLKIKLDSNFVPRVVPQAPRIWITQNGGVGLSLSRDVKDVDNIPKIIRTSLLRFFTSEAGMRLKWSEAKKERAIQRLIEGARKVVPKSEKTQYSLSGCWNIDFKVLFVEHVKVVYEICCSEFGRYFRDSLSGQRLRTFLLAQCTDTPKQWKWIKVAQHLNIVPQVSLDLDGFIKHLTNNSQHPYHVAVVVPNGVVCSMFGMGAMFHNKDFEKVPTASGVKKVYMSNINGGKSGVFDLSEIW